MGIPCLSFVEIWGFVSCGFRNLPFHLLCEFQQTLKVVLALVIAISWQPIDGRLYSTSTGGVGMVVVVSKKKELNPAQTPHVCASVHLVITECVYM